MPEFLQKAIFVLVPMFLSLTVHEYAHARTAYALGDRTAAAMGRMTLNPLSHIDLFGTIILPLLAIWGGGPFFGWAKPVPINPLMFSRRVRMKTGLLLTAAAGPASNLVFALLMAFGINLFAALKPEWSLTDNTLSQFLWIVFQINIVLAVFNFIPVPPLDGSRVLTGLLPDRLAAAYSYLERNPIFIIVIFAVLITQAGRLISGPVTALAKLLLSLTEPLVRLLT